MHRVVRVDGCRALVLIAVLSERFTSFRSNHWPPSWRWLRRIEPVERGQRRIHRLNAVQILPRNHHIAFADRIVLLPIMPNVIPVLPQHDDELAVVISVPHGLGIVALVDAWPRNETPADKTEIDQRALRRFSFFVFFATRRQRTGFDQAARIRRF